MNEHDHGNNSKGNENEPAALPKSLTLILALLKKNLHLLLMWSTLVFGGIILLFHFLYIEYFPKLDLTSSLVLLAIIALTGGTIIGFLTLTLIIPSVLWSIFFESNAGKQAIDTLNNRNQNNSTDSLDFTVETQSTDYEQSNYPKTNHHLLWLGGIFAVPITINLFVFVLVGTGLFYFPYFFEKIPLSITPVLFLLIILWGYLTYKKSKLPKLTWTETLLYQGILMGSFGMYLLTPFLIYMRISSRKRANRKQKQVCPNNGSLARRLNEPCLPFGC
jgi:hypothetical protein